mmetsp:Transcript_76879/g.238129  ORF Transcript_76879/g.238129 Transcript_76879/m.238129 type:complete len:358 (+) Transcript_76879:56-1129(+)
MQQWHSSMIRLDTWEMVLARVSARGRGRIACTCTPLTALLHDKFPSQPYGTCLTVWGGQWDATGKAHWFMNGRFGMGTLAFRHHFTRATVLLRDHRGSRPTDVTNVTHFSMRCGQGGPWMRYVEDFPVEMHEWHTGLGGFFQDSYWDATPIESSREDMGGAQWLFETIRRDCGKHPVTLIPSIDGFDIDLGLWSDSWDALRNCSVTEDGSLALRFEGPGGSALRLELSRSGVTLCFVSAKDWPRNSPRRGHSRGDIPEPEEHVRVGLRFYTPAEKSGGCCAACGAVGGSISLGCGPCRNSWNAGDPQRIPACAGCGVSSGCFGAWGGGRWWCQACWEVYDKGFKHAAAQQGDAALQQ